MASNGPVKGNKRATSGSTQYNALEFLIRNVIQGLVNTAIPVIVTAVDAGGASEPTGYVTVKPLVCQVDGFGETLDPAELFRVPYARVQGGADGFYLGGFLNRAPSVYVEVKQDQSIVITASSGVTVNAPTVTVPSGDVIASGISLVHHTHTGDSGGTTSPPN